VRPSHYSVNNVGDIDFIIETRRKSLSSPAEYYGLEVKLSKNWTPQFEKMSNTLVQKRPKGFQKVYAVYTGTHRLTRPSITVLPLETFVTELWRGELF
jgi:hypothetical protein